MANENTLNTVLFPALIERMQERNMSRKKTKIKKKSEADQPFWLYENLQIDNL